MGYRILDIDPYLAPYEKDIDLRMNSYKRKKKELKEVVDILKKMNEKELAATKYFGLGVVASSEGRTEPTAHK